jgi:hypothetical protein
MVRTSDADPRARHRTASSATTPTSASTSAPTSASVDASAPGSKATSVMASTTTTVAPAPVPELVEVDSESATAAVALEPPAALTVDPATSYVEVAPPEAVSPPSAPPDSDLEPAPDRRSRTDRATTWIVAGVVLVGGLTGLVLRLWWIFHYPSTSDIDVVGLIAQAGVHGHFQALYPGQAYGGTAEVYLISLAFAVFGQTAVVAELVLGALSFVSCLLVWRIALRAVGDQRIALLAATLCWSGSLVFGRTTVIPDGFRSATLVCGLAGILLAARIRDQGPSIGDAALLGLLAGVGWWSSPEFVYFGLPIVILLSMRVVATPRPRWRPLTVPGLVVVLTFGIGALPWIWANSGSGFRSLRTASPGLVIHTTYTGRLSEFFHVVLPGVLGLRLIADAAPSVGSAYGALSVACLVLIGASVVLAVWRGGLSAALALAVLAFPFVYAVSPFAQDWADGRYGLYAVPLVAMVVGIGVSEGTRRLQLPRWAGSLVLAGVVTATGILTVYDNHQSNLIEHAGFTSGWSNPDRGTMATVAQLEAAGVRAGYANYWVAYKLDFYSRGRLEITTAGYDTNRIRAFNVDARRSRRPAWLFVPARESLKDGTQFNAPTLTVGPDSVTERAFTTRLRFLHIRYRTIDTGLLRAVIPSVRLTPYQAGLPGTSPP